MKKKNKLKVIVVLGLLITLIGFNKIGIAGDDNIGWSFTINPYHANSYSTGRYRQTKSTSNPWKVKLNESGEGKGTITTFWLAKQVEPQYWQVASVTKNVKQGEKKATYSGANKSANQSTVSLAAENNNYSANSYTAKGIWDEETWD